MRQFAKICNVSVSTVSKAFNNAEDISDETKNYIFETAKTLGCFETFNKGKFHKKVIAIICPELNGDYYAGFVSKLKELIEKSNAICVISADEFNSDKQIELIEYYAAYLKVDGLIVFNLKQEINKNFDVPIIALLSKSSNTERTDRINNIDSITIDLRTAMFKAVNILHNFGHEKIAFIGERLTPSKERNFKEAMKEEGLLNFETVQSEYRFENAGIDGVQKLKEKDFDYSALICAYDRIAFGAIKELKTMGKMVPQDVSVVGIDNISSSEFTQISLTTIGADLDEICEITWDLMKKKLDNKFYKSKQNITIMSELIIRESVKKIN